MSKMTQSIRLSLIAAAVLMGAFASASADGLGDVNRAMNDFYKGVRDSKDKTPETISKIKEETLAPATHKMIESERKKLLEPGSTGGSAPSGEGPASLSEPIMDSRDVPRELDFPGSSKMPASPKPATKVK